MNPYPWLSVNEYGDYEIAIEGVPVAEADRRLVIFQEISAGRLDFASREQDGQRLYQTLAIFDKRDGTFVSNIVQAAREGWERSHPDMDEENAWDDFERLIEQYRQSQRPYGTPYGKW